MTMEENKKKAFDFAADLTKQLITLSTAIITLSVTFSKDIVGGINDSLVYLLIGTWAIYIVSIFLGLSTLGALTGNLDPTPKKTKGDDGKDGETVVSPILTITSDNVTSTSKWQIYTFILALILTCVYGYVSVSKKQKPEINHKGDYMIIRVSQLNIDTIKYIDTLYVPRNK